MQRALAETDRRRQKQMAYNEAHGISPQSVKRAIADGLEGGYESSHTDYELKGVAEEGAASQFVRSNFQTTLKSLEARMREAASNLEFEEAAKLRDELKRMRLLELDMATDFLKS
jgi:excinuclease ABC subunit B